MGTFDHVKAVMLTVKSMVLAVLAGSPVSAVSDAQEAISANEIMGDHRSFGELSPESQARKISELRDFFEKSRRIWIDASQMAGVLKYFGATEADIQKLREVSARCPMDPTLPFRRSRQGRFVFDRDRGTIHRTEHQGFVLSASEGFKRRDSGMIRHFDDLQDDVQKNTAFQALLSFKHYMISRSDPEQRPNLDYRSPQAISTVFNLRTVTSPDLVGEPAIEGVHSDGVDFTLTIFLGSKNMEQSSAMTFIHDNQETTGIANKDVDPDLIQGKVCHSEFLDTLLFFDNEMKHSLTPVKAKDPSKDSTRDMFVVFTRKPTLPDHHSFEYDSVEPHPELPVRFDAIS